MALDTNRVDTIGGIGGNRIFRRGALGYGGVALAASLTGTRSLQPAAAQEPAGTPAGRDRLAQTLYAGVDRTANSRSRTRRRHDVIGVRAMA